MGEKPYEQYTNDFGFEQGKVVIARYPQDIDDNLHHNLRTAKKNAVFIFPNRLNDTYNPLFALRVFQRINEKYPDTKMLMNESGYLKKECQAFIKKSGLGNSVKFLDSIKKWDDLPELYEQADIALFTAVDSNGPNTLIECMASGMGVVASKYIHNIQAYARAGENCFICDLKEDDYLHAVVQYMENEQLLSEHGALSKEFVKDRSIKKTAEFYYSILSKQDIPQEIH